MRCQPSGLPVPVSTQSRRLGWVMASNLRIIGQFLSPRRDFEDRVKLRRELRA